MVDMADLTTPKTGTEALKVVWSVYIGGPAGSSVASDVEVMKKAIDQAFVQSPYLKKTR
jgi:hypothetical protein